MAFFGADETGDTVFLNREVAKDAKGYLILPRSGGDPGKDHGPEGRMVLFCREYPAKLKGAFLCVLGVLSEAGGCLKYFCFTPIG